MAKPTVASLSEDLETYRASTEQTIARLVDQISALSLQVKVLASPLNETKTTAQVQHQAAQPHTSSAGKGLVTPSCVNFRKCGNKSSGVPLRKHTAEEPGAIGWKCDPCTQAGL